MKNNISIFILIAFLAILAKPANGQEAKNPFNPNYDNTLIGHIEAVKGNSELRKTGFKALSEYWPASTVQRTLVDLYEDADPAHAVGYLEIIGQIHNDSLLPLYTPLLLEEDARPVRFASKVIAKHGYPTAVSALRESLLSRKIDDSTFSLIDALEQISTLEALSALRDSRKVISSNTFLSNHLEQAIQRLESFHQATSPQEFIRSALSDSESLDDFYWACRKVLQDESTYASVDFIKRIYNDIDAREEMLSSILEPGDPVVRSEKEQQEYSFTYTKMVRLLLLRVEMGDQLSDREKEALEIILYKTNFF